MKRADYLLALGLFGLALIYYVYQVCPTFYFWDSAELAAAIAAGGIPHPPGFPLYLILANLFCYILPFDIGKASGLFSAFCGSVSVGIFYLTLLKLLNDSNSKLTIKRILASGGSISLAISASLTAQSTRGEVYALNLMLFMLGLYFISELTITKNSDRFKSRGFILSLLFLGLGIANHHLTILLVLPAIMYLAISERLDYRIMLIGIFLLILPLTIYSYLIVLARSNPDLNWGDPQNLSGLINIFFGKGFNTPSSAFNAGHIWENCSFDIALLYRQVGPLLGLFSIVGIIVGWGKRRKLTVFILLCILFNLLSTIFNEMYYYENADLHGYLLISLVGLIIFSMIGFQETAKWITARYSNLVVTLVLIVSVIIPGYVNIGWANLSGNYSAKKLATTMIDECPQNALVVTSSYNTYFILKAMQNVYNYRRDLKVTNAYLFGQKWYRDDFSERYALKQQGVNTADPKSFYRDLINKYKDSSEIYIEYDGQSSPLRNYLYPQGLFMKFNNTLNDWGQIDKAKFIERDLANFKNIVYPGMDYEELKSIMLILDGREKYFRAIGQTEMAARYLEEIEKTAVASQK